MPGVNRCYTVLMKNTIIAILGLALIGVAVYFLTDGFKGKDVELEPREEITVDEVNVPYTAIGTSTESREIKAYTFGEGDKTLVYVGAMHGGYEWNSALLSYALIDYLQGNPERIPSDVRVVVIPVANPDGLAKVVGTSDRFKVSDAPQFDYADEVEITSIVVQGRFNANGVDLNRNFDCKWQPEAIWRTNKVSAGSSAFSEPEARALRDFLLKEKPEAVVFYHSASNGVFASFCEGDALQGTVDLLSAYSAASGYPRFDEYPYYEITGDVADWLSTQNIPAITVELETHDVAEWEKNLAGVEAMFKLYSTNN